jgi:hypothetical protein
MQAAVIEDRVVCARADNSQELFVCVCSSDLVRLLAEYGLDDGDVEGLITTRTPIGVGGVRHGDLVDPLVDRNTRQRRAGRAQRYGVVRDVRP